MIPRSLRRKLSGFRRVAVALSGGVDSAVLTAAVARVLGPEAVLTLTATGPIFPPEELKLARRTARLLGVVHQEVRFEALRLPAFRENPPDRCYYCKRALLEAFWLEARRFGAEVLFDGTQKDDLEEDRPGLLALRELGVKSPLAEAGLGKAAVRHLARLLGLPQAEREASPCLATRFPPGEPVTLEGLRLVYRAEKELRSRLGLWPLRVRWVRGEARLEVPPSEIPAVFARRGEVLETLKALGFRRVSLDLEGYRGSSRL